MSVNEESYLVGKDRQEKSGMPACRCSNCERDACKILATRGKWLTMSNFDTGLRNPETLMDLQPGNNNANDSELRMNENNDPDSSIVNQKLKGPPARRIELIPLAELLTLTIQNQHEKLMGNEDRLKASDYLDKDDIWRILNQIHSI